MSHMQFKEISKAYEILSDEEKRGIYDRHGLKGVEEGAGGHDASNVFSAMFGGGGGRPAGKPKGKDVLFPLNVTLADLYTGGT